MKLQQMIPHGPVAALLVLLAIPNGVLARQIPVAPPGSGAADLSQALANASAGDSLMLAPGFYAGEQTLKRGVSVIGVAGPDSTILDADGGRYVLFGRDLDSTTVITGLTLQNGRRPHPNSGGGGIYLYRSSPVILDNVFRNHLGYLGPGVYMNYDCRAVVAFNVFYENEGYLGGAVSAYQDCQPLVYNNILYDNTAVSGGGVLSMNSNPVILNNTIVANHAKHGGAIYCDSSPALIRGNLMAFNADAGAIYWLDDDKPASVQDNMVWNNAGGESGGLCPPFLNIAGNCGEDPAFVDIENRDLTRRKASTGCLPTAGARSWNSRSPASVPDSVLALWRDWTVHDRSR